MAKEIPIGARGEARETVEFKHTLSAHHPDLPPVYSTPDMIRLMETAAFHALHGYCENGEITVGTSIHIEHRAASGVGAQIQAEAILESFDGRFYTLRVTARDDVREIGSGTVGRVVVSIGKFLEKTKANSGKAEIGGPHPLAPHSSSNIPHPHSAVAIKTYMANLEQQQARASAFRALHTGKEILLLPNAWDVASARIVEESGFHSVATTSAGIAFALGYADGQIISREEMLAAVTRIAHAVNVPVTADVESGYGKAPEDAAHTARAVIATGAVGMNLEDTVGDAPALAELPLQLEKIRAIREAANRAKVPLVLNARTDVYLLQIGDPAKRYDETVRRLSAFRDAGADCVFAPGLRDAATIDRLVADLKCPLNILAGPGSPSVPELSKLGVARVSLGSAPMRAALGHLRRIAEELKATGTYAALDGAPSHVEMNLLMRRDQH